MTTRLDVRGRLVLDDRVVAGQLAIDDGPITAVDIDDESPGAGADMPFVTPGFVDVHVHGWGGHDAMGVSERPWTGWPGLSCATA